MIHEIEKYRQKEKAIPGYKKSWFIFGRIKPFSQTNLDRVKDLAIKKANIKRIRIHDLRHSHASNLIAEGVNIVAVSKRLGHSDISMTLKVYTHLLQKTNDEMIDIVENSSKKLFE